MTSRQSIVDALGAVPGLAVSPYRPTVVAPGQAWLEADAYTRVQGRIFDQSWTIVVAVATDPRAAEQWWDTNVPGLVDTINTACIVNDVRPSSMAIDTSAVYTVRLAVSE